jgi:ABC-type transporter Mla subunit MlaD
MPEDVFRIVVTAGVVIAALAFVVQAVAMAILVRLVRQLQVETIPLMDQALPVLVRLGPAIEKIQALTEKAAPVLEKAGRTIEKAGEALDTAQEILGENRPRIAQISTEVAGMARTGREQVERLGELLHEAGEGARARLDRIESVVDNTVDQVEQAGDAVKRAVLRPVREANGIAAGISAAVSTLIRGRKSSVESATQDEEMFI